MSRSDWRDVFWTGVIITGLAGVPLSGALGFWWRHEAGIFFGIGAWAVLFGAVLALIAFQMAFHGGSGRE